MGNEDGEVTRTTLRFRFSSLLKKDTVTPAYSPLRTVFNVSQTIVRRNGVDLPLTTLMLLLVKKRVRMDEGLVWA